MGSKVFNFKNSQEILIITGPTSSGKSNYALNIAKECNGVIINADALQVYSDFPILTDQPTKEEQILVDHRLYGFMDIENNFSVDDWISKVQIEIKSIKAEGKLPIIVGGTCMYIYLLVHGIVEMPKFPEEIRNTAEALFNNIGYDEFLAKVKKKDPKTPTDRQRLIRNYCLLKETKKSLHQWSLEPKILPLGKEKFKLIALSPPREEVYKKCNDRFSNMLETGVIEEVQNCIIKHGEAFRGKRMSGYTEIRDYILNRISKEECITISTQATRLHAKQQYTWIKGKLAPFINIKIESMQR